MVRGDSAFGTKKMIATAVSEGIEFSFTLIGKRAITAAIESIDESAYTPVHYPGAVIDPDTGALISDAEVAETPYTLRLGHGKMITARLVVRRVKDARYQNADALFPVWRYHPFVTNSELSTTEADLTHRRHAIIETTFADLIDGPLAHLPSTDTKTAPGASPPNERTTVASAWPNTRHAPVPTTNHHHSELAWFML